MYDGLYTASGVGMIECLLQFYRSREQSGSRNYSKQFADVKNCAIATLIALLTSCR